MATPFFTEIEKVGEVLKHPEGHVILASMHRMRMISPLFTVFMARRRYARQFGWSLETIDRQDPVEMEIISRIDSAMGGISG